METIKTANHGWRVTFAGTGINLALGVLYTWSVISAAIPDSWGWNQADKALPYSVACFVFALAMILAGRLQDRFGPAIVASIGGVLVGLGCIIAWQAGSSLAGFVVGFGVFAGVGIGFGYASATPPAVKWFPPAKTGLIAGLVVSGFGLASVYIAPLAKYLTSTVGVSTTMLVFGIGFLIVVVTLAQFLKNPPAGYVAQAPAPKKADDKPAAPAAANDVNWKDMLKTSQFWLLWFMYACGSAAGLMLIGIATKLGKASLGASAFFVVVALSVGNAGGRIFAGILSDKIGRQWTMFGAYLLQAVMVLSLIYVGTSAALLLLIVMIAGANYGANLSLFPSATKDYFGLKGFGLNYGLMFTAWGVGGLILPRVNGMIIDATGNSDIAFMIAGGLMVVAAAMTFVSRAIAEKSQTIAPAKAA
ncbi:MAG: OFA family MFS transporter [Phycisphaerae bacterium]|nr:OFA family MFS transporter [Phycisphaerae bacterium]